MKQEWVNRIIDERAKAAGITSPWQADEVKDLFLPIFTWKGLDSWEHASAQDLQSGNDRVITGEVAQAAQSYMRVEWAQDERLDWLLADAMAFGEVNATFKTLSPTRFYFFDGKPVWWMVGLKVAFSMILWVAWLFVLFLIYDESESMAAAFVVVTAAYQFAKRRRAQPVAKMLGAMAATYSALDSNPPSWRNLYALMEKSRDLGAKWPTQLYRLVEKRLAG